MDTHQFQADVRQILHLVTHSIYSDREVFLRELISNASDALDAARFESLQQADLLPAEEPGIRVAVDAEAGTITISDDGIGLTADQARENLGTIAQSGTKALAAAIKERGEDASSMIGQFGVGFYASFMVADKVVVTSRSALPDSEAIEWTSDGGDGYTLVPSDREARGTDIVLHIREDSAEFLDADKIRDIIKKHSEFVSWPVSMDDERVNQQAALWTRDPREVTEEEYIAFYKHISGDWQEPLITLHVRAEAPLQYQAILFVPARRPWELDRLDFKVGLKLYQKRIKILDHADSLIPRFLRFVTGVVDSPDVDLNVSREILQQTAVVATIKKQLTSRVLKKLRDLTKSDEGAEKYNAFWTEMGHLLKEGIHEDDGSKKLLTGLLRYPSTSSGGDLRSLAQVKESMVEGQDTIWYLTDVDKERIASKPVLEGFKQRDWEVMLMTDPVDEWVVMSIKDFEDSPLKSAAHGDLPEAPEEERSEEEQKARTEATPLATWMGEMLSGDVAEVRLSSRLTNSPSVLVNKEGAMGANMENILKAANQQVSQDKQVLEINPEHPMVRTLARLNSDGSPGLEPFARLLLDHAQIAEGQVADPAGFASRLQVLMEKAASSM
ncbi:MAG: molecular chaperone HtpG [Myxococcota bacterium]|jgi:molecular chaperone HtpG